MKKVFCLCLTALSVFACKKITPETRTFTYVVEPGPNEIEVKYFTKNEQENFVDLKAISNWKKEVELLVGQDYLLDAKTKNFNNNQAGKCNIFILKGLDTIRFASFEVDQGTDIKWATLQGEVVK